MVDGRRGHGVQAGTMPPVQIRPTHAEIDLGALRHNLAEIRSLVGPQVGVCAVVKANAYGHGAVRVGLELERAGVEFLGVNTTEEGLELREAGIACDILVMGGVFADSHLLVATERLTPVVCRLEDIDAFGGITDGAAIPLHLKFDTGMGRLGFFPDQVPEVLERCRKYPHLAIEGVMTHLASAELADRTEEVRQQLARFEQVRASLSRGGCSPRFVHAANSAAMARYREARLNLVRPGLLLYGAHPADDLGAELDLQPAMRVLTEIVHLRDLPAGHGISYGRRYVTGRASRIATLPIGYADGIPRAYSPGGEVLVRGERAPVVGAVCMDMLMVDVTDVPAASCGDQVVLLGGQGHTAIAVEELARFFHEIPHEAFCSFTARVPRVFRAAPTRES